MRASLLMGWGLILWSLGSGCGQENSTRVQRQRGPVPREEGHRNLIETSRSVMISEFMAENDSILLDGRGEYSDWIELYNFGDDLISLAGWALTDDPALPDRWVFPERDLSPGEYLVVFASGEAGRGATDLHANFKLSADGEFLALVAPEGTFVHRFEPAYPQQRTDLSYGVASGWSPGQMLIDYEGYFVAASPGRPNSELLLGRVEPVLFSQASGLFPGSVSLSLSTRTAGAEIFYTLDGRKPALDSGLRYEAPILLTADTVVRARALKEQHQPSPVETATYFLAGTGAFYGEDQPEQSLPIVSLSLAPDELFGEAGIYDQALPTGREGERAATIEWWDRDDEIRWVVDCGLRVRHDAPGSSHNGQSKRSLRIYFRDLYGPSQLKEPVFGESGAHRFDRFDLIACPAVTDRSTLATFVWNRLSQDLIGDAGEPFLRGRYCQLYLNGRYWGLYEWVERPDSGYAREYFGGSKSDFDIVQRSEEATPGDGDEIYEASEGDLEAWLAMVEEVSEANSPEQGSALLDWDSMITYAVTAWFRGGAEPGWGPWVGVRNREGSDGFRVMMAGRAAYPGERSVRETDSMASDGLGQLWDELKENEEFRMRIHDRVQDVFFEKGPLAEGRLAQRIRRLTSQLAEPILADRRRWEGEGKAFEWKETSRWLQNYVESRRSDVLDRLRSQGMVASLGVPTWGLSEGRVELGTELLLTAKGTAIYATTDGSDPREPGGELAEAAFLVGGPLVLTEPTIVTCRLRQDEAWGPLSRRAFDVVPPLN